MLASLRESWPSSLPPLPPHLLIFSSSEPRESGPRTGLHFKAYNNGLERESERERSEKRHTDIEIDKVYNRVLEVSKLPTAQSCRGVFIVSSDSPTRIIKSCCILQVRRRQGGEILSCALNVEKSIDTEIMQQPK